MKNTVLYCENLSLITYQICIDFFSEKKERCIPNPLENEFARIESVSEMVWDRLFGDLVGPILDIRIDILHSIFLSVLGENNRNLRRKHWQNHPNKSTIQEIN